MIATAFAFWLAIVPSDAGCTAVAVETLFKILYRNHIELTAIALALMGWVSVWIERWRIAPLASEGRGRRAREGARRRIEGEPGRQLAATGEPCAGVP